MQFHCSSYLCIKHLCISQCSEGDIFMYTAASAHAKKKTPLSVQSAATQTLLYLNLKITFHAVNSSRQSKTLISYSTLVTGRRRAEVPKSTLPCFCLPSLWLSLWDLQQATMDSRQMARWGCWVTIFRTLGSSAIYKLSNKCLHSEFNLL